MAAGVIVYTPGSGANAHSETYTRGANSGHVPYVNIGEPQLPHYVVTAENIAVSTANSHLLQVMAGSALNLAVRGIRIRSHTLPAAVTAIFIQVWRLSTAGTGGTALTPAKLKTGDAAAGATAMTLPTVKGSEVAGGQVWTEALWLPTAAIPGVPLWDWLPAPTPNSEPFVIAAGTANGFAIKNVNTVATATVDIDVTFAELNY